MTYKERKKILEDAEKKAIKKESELKRIASNEQYKHDRYQENRKKNSKKGRANIKLKTDIIYNELSRAKNATELGLNTKKKLNQFYDASKKEYNIIFNPYTDDQAYKEAAAKIGIIEKFQRTARARITCANIPIKILEDSEIGFFRKLFGLKAKTRIEKLEDKIKKEKPEDIKEDMKTKTKKSLWKL